MKKYLIIIVVVAVVLIGFIWFSGSHGADPKLTIANAFKQTFSVKSGAISGDIKMTQNGSASSDVILNLAYSLSDSLATSGTADLSAAFNTGNSTNTAEGWLSWDANNIANTAGIFSLPSISNSYYVVDSADINTTAQVSDLQKSITTSLIKNFPVQKWTKKGSVYSTTMTPDVFVAYYQAVLTDISGDANFAGYQTLLSSWINNVANVKNSLGANNIGIAVTITGKTVSKVEIASNVSAITLPSGWAPLVGDTTLAGKLDITLDLTKVGALQTINMPTVNSDNSISPFASDNSVIVYVNNSKANFTGYVDGYTLMLPARPLIETLGGQMQYQQLADGTNEVTGTLGSTTVVLDQDSTTATVNGAAQTLDVAVTNNNGTEYLPARFIVQSLGKNISAVKNPRGQTLVYITD